MTIWLMQGVLRISESIYSLVKRLFLLFTTALPSIARTPVKRLFSLGGLVLSKCNGLLDD